MRSASFARVFVCFIRAINLFLLEYLRDGWLDAVGSDSWAVMFEQVAASVEGMAGLPPGAAGGRSLWPRISDKQP